MNRPTGWAAVTLCLVALAGCGDDSGTTSATGTGAAGGGGSGASGGDGGGGASGVGDSTLVSDGMAIAAGDPALSARQSDWAIAWKEEDGGLVPLRYATVAPDGTVSAITTLADNAAEGPYLHNGATADDVAVSYDMLDDNARSQVHFAIPGGDSGQVTDIDSNGIVFDHVWDGTGWTVVTCEENSPWKMNRFDFTAIPGTPIVPPEPPYVLLPAEVESCDHVKLRTNSTGVWLAIQNDVGDVNSVHLWKLADDENPIDDGILLGDAAVDAQLIGFETRGDELAVSYWRADDGFAYLEIFDQDGTALGEPIQLGEAPTIAGLGALSNGYALSWKKENTLPADLLVRAWDPDGTPRVAELRVDTHNSLGPYTPALAALTGVMGIAFVDEDPGTMTHQLYLARVPDL